MDQIKKALKAYCSVNELQHDPYKYVAIPMQYNERFHKIGMHYYHGAAMQQESVNMCYNSLKQLLSEQFILIVTMAGIRPELVDGGEPYDSYEELMEDFDGSVLKSRTTCSKRDSVEVAKTDPMFPMSPFYDINNKQMCWNDVFRFVHDVIGHLQHGNTFEFTGEYNAYRAHRMTMAHRPDALPALMNETLYKQCGYYVHELGFGPARVVTIDLGD